MSKRHFACDVEAEFFGEERKKEKQARRALEAKDRSKFKKTDKEKWLAQWKKEQKRGLEEENFLEGRVLSITPQEIKVAAEDTLYSCQVRGLLKKEMGQEKNLVVVGDFVYFKPLSHFEGSIFHVKERFSLLARADNLSRRKQHLIAANIDQVLITLSLVFPPLKPFLADRYIIAAEKGGMKPILVVNKIDLLKDSKEEKESYEAFLKGYSSVDIPLISVSSKTGEGIEELKKVMANKASVFSGQSGVGKSSLINVLTGKDLKVGEPVKKTGKGSQTTTSAELIPLAFGGFCIDTPGIKSFGVWDLERDEIEAYFDEIHSIGQACKFPNCFHSHEKECAVKKALEEGHLSPLRYYSYLNLIETIDEEHLRR